MKELTCDMLVIGAGPGGSTTARYAAERGVDVLMIEKRQEIGAPVRCGEGIARIWLNELGIEPDDAWISKEVDGARVISPSGHILEMNEKMAGNETGYVVERDLFDQYLARTAVKAGSELMVKTMATGLKQLDDGVEVKTTGIHGDMRIKAKVVVGADGFESRVAGWAGIDTRLPPEHVNTCLQYRMMNIGNAEEFNDFYAGECAPGGYVWVFSKGDGEANVGIGVQASLLNGYGGVKYYLDKFVKKHPFLSKGTIIEVVGGAVSVGPPPDETMKGNVLLVGDAARQIDALTGGGVVNACDAGKVAGNVIADAVESGKVNEEALKPYESGWRERMEKMLVRNYIAKEKILTMSDDFFDRIILALQEVEIERVTTLDILTAVQKKDPELVEELADLL